MLESELQAEKETQKNEKICACGKSVSETFQFDLCRECLTERFKILIQVIDSVRK